MFHKITKTWNPVIGCLHNCSYCWARPMAETKLAHMEKYKDGFQPKIVTHELKKRFRKQYVFVSDMGDLFGNWVPKEWILEVLATIKNSPSSYFLFLTKNPARYFEFTDVFPENLVLGATIETNREYTVAKAPTVTERYQSITKLPYKRKMISIEPIMDFDPKILVSWIKEISPIVVHVGYANHNHNLPEPTLAKTKTLISDLRPFTKVKILRLREQYNKS